jgi:hypothetical protein
MQYEAPEVIEIGEAQKLILGADKGFDSSDDDFPMFPLTFAVNEVEN